MPENDRPQYTWMSLLLWCIYGIFFILFIVQGVVGCVYINDCPGQPSIPILMATSGLISFFWALSWCKNGCRVFCYCIIATLYLIWLTYGATAIYVFYSFNISKSHFDCNKTFCLFAFWCSNVTYILTGIYICCFISACCNERMEPFVLYNDENQPLL
ncbi:unnamed protein product [Oreochromis niloticus]|nr:unnamed protein product [Mustela putorius furo]